MACCISMDYNRKQCLAQQGKPVQLVFKKKNQTNLVVPKMSNRESECSVLFLPVRQYQSQQQANNSYVNFDLATVVAQRRCSWEFLKRCLVLGLK